MPRPRNSKGPALLACYLCGLALAAPDAQAQAEEEWFALFDGESLDGWIPKIRGYEAGVNYGDTFRVEDGLLTVAYDAYESFDDRFGHLFYERPFSHYRLRLEYRFIGEQVSGGADWARRNSGVMLHSPAPETMPPGQDFPISVEVQFLGGLGAGNHRSTGNLCTPGTNVVYQGEFTTSHCINSSSATFDGDQWVSAEILVLGHERIVHSINGEPVIEYANPTLGGGSVSGHRPELMVEGQPVDSGYLSLQSESHPVQYRRVEILDLSGCMNVEAPGFRPWYVVHDEAACD